MSEIGEQLLSLAVDRKDNRESGIREHHINENTFIHPPKTNNILPSWLSLIFDVKKQAPGYALIPSMPCDTSA